MYEDTEMVSSGQESLNEYRNSVVHYILNNSCNKYPLKQSEIVSRVLNGKHQLFNQVVGEVKEALETTYGMELKLVPDTKSGKQYICVSKFTAASSMEYDETQRSQLTLLFLVLSYIFMKGVAVNEESLEQFLKGLRIYYDRPHPFFGSNIKKLITDTFVKQLYLKKTKSDADSTENTLFYSWGYRSSIEFPQKGVLEAVSQLLNKPAKYFVMQYSQASSNETSEN